MLFFINANANEWTGNVNFFLGQKTLDEDDWAPLDKQGEFGVLVDFKQQNWPVSIAIDFLGSADDGTDSRRLETRPFLLDDNCTFQF